jgi:hypothetical protein
VNGRLECSEIVLLDNLSYGTYRWVVATDLSRLANSLTLGLFLWSDSDDFAHREIDIEAGVWGTPRGAAGARNNRVDRPPQEDMQFVLQPFTVPGNMVRFSLGTFKGPSVHSFTWTPGRIAFETTNGGRVVKRFVLDRGVPPPGPDQHVRINLWNTTRELATDGVAEVVVKDFSYEPRR